MLFIQTSLLDPGLVHLRPRDLLVQVFEWVSKDSRGPETILHLHCFHDFREHVLRVEL